MTEKEATIFIVDLGQSMSYCNNGRTESDLDWSMRYVWDKISTVVAASRKTLYVGVLGLRTAETNHAMSGEEGYENISILQPLEPMTVGSLKKLRGLVRCSDVDIGDAISAVVIAVEMIVGFTKKLKYKRQIYLVTDGLSPIDGDDFENISSKINESEIELTVL
jgi:ATP-dependent DNA helicase 2 subunit 2